MKLYYYRATQGNFGDDLNSWLWEELVPGRWSDEDDGELFCGIGTIIGTLGSWNNGAARAALRCRPTHGVAG